MRHLDAFLALLCGRFDNARQLEELKQTGGPALPYAEHVNTICNEKIAGLPADFPGKFVLEESYYTTDGRTHASPHLFLFTEEGEAVKLTSYQLPKASGRQPGLLGDPAAHAVAGPGGLRASSRPPSIRCTAAYGRAAASACSPRC